MVFKIKTSKKAEDIISRLELSHNLPCYTLVKLAMALSLRSEKPLEESDFKTNTLGRELNRQTITGEYDDLFKALILQKENKNISDEELMRLVQCRDEKAFDEILESKRNPEKNDMEEIKTEMIDEGTELR